MAKTGFQPGNKAAAGHGPVRAKPVTQVIIQKLNEVNAKTDRAYVFDLVDELFEQAMAKETTVGKGKKKTVIRTLGDLAAKKEIIDRADGKSVQGVGFDGTGSGKVTITFDAEDKGAL